MVTKRSAKMKGVTLVGVELEGAWVTRPAGFVHDGSVSGFFVNPTNPDQDLYTKGELPSPPLPPGDAPGAIGEWMLAHYPDATNSTCGLHVHVSFDTAVEYSMLMSHAKGLEETLISDLTVWAKEHKVSARHSFWNRLHGGNRFCALGGDPDEQATVRGKVGGVRQKALNFCHRLHGTLEVRLLPAFKSKALAVSAVAQVVATVNRVLATLPRLESMAVETNLGPLVVVAKPYGFRLELRAATAVKAAARDLLGFDRRVVRSSRYDYDRTATEVKALVSKLLKTRTVRIKVASRVGLEDKVAKVKAMLDTLRVSVTRVNAETEGGTR